MCFCANVVSLRYHLWWAFISVCMCGGKFCPWCSFHFFIYSVYKTSWVRCTIGHDWLKCVGLSPTCLSLLVETCTVSYLNMLSTSMGLLRVKVGQSASQTASCFGHCSCHVVGLQTSCDQWRVNNGSFCKFFELLVCMPPLHDHISRQCQLIYSRPSDTDTCKPSGRDIQNIARISLNYLFSIPKAFCSYLTVQLINPLHHAKGP